MAVKRKSLAIYDYGMGGSWAGPEDRIKRYSPDLEVVDDDPARMTEELRARTKEHPTFDTDATTGWLAVSEEDQR